MDRNDGRVVSNFILQSIQGNPLTIYGDGQQTRSFCYVDDMVDAVMRLMNSDDSIVGPMNLGNPMEHSMLDLAKTIVSILDREVLFQFKKLPKDDPKQRQPDITYAKNVLNWEPQVNLQDGLKKTIRYFKNLL